MRKSLKESLRGNNNAKKIGKSCFKVKNYFHISMSHLSYNIKVYFSEVRLVFEPLLWKISTQRQDNSTKLPSAHKTVNSWLCVFTVIPIPTTPDYLENLR